MKLPRTTLLLGLSTGLLALQILLFFVRDFPFSHKLEKGAKSRGLIAAFVCAAAFVMYSRRDL